MPRSSTPQIFRILIQAADLAKSCRFYALLLATHGRQVAPGRVYFDCGPVLLGVLDYSRTRPKERVTPAEAIYFATDDLEGLHRRASKLGGLSTELIHNVPANPSGAIVVRPWGERSFYAVDPAGNPLCFVDRRTVFRGTTRQIAALRRQTSSRVPPGPRKTSGRALSPARRRPSP